MDQDIFSRLETSFEEAFLSGQVTRCFWVNGCRQTQRLTQMDMAAPMLMFPIVGQKTATVGDQVYHTSPGEMLLLPAAVRFDLANIPTVGENRFLGASLVFDALTIDLFRKAYSDAAQGWPLASKWKINGSDEVYSLIADWLAHDRAYHVDIAQTRHRLAEILLILARQGVAGNLLQPRAQTVRDQLTQRLMTDLSRDWSASDLAAALAMSESTLRRRLREEQTGFRQLLEDARLNQGVERVISSDMPIGQIALECGYQSQSRFAERFRLRFSMSPTELRSSQRQRSGDIVALETHRAGI
ncbi:helix-turn-helix domain-containing protein [Parasphingorhabdus sp.]|uniref:helix-turn-helix transcriptional regulator n=1 Tax=Parasphingorhabdus sp. TaxID=2709688 RepID=UPI003297B9C2